MIIKIITTLALSLALFSCNNAEKKKTVSETETQLEGEHHHDESTEIELNNGQKWKVVDEMMEHIRNMEKDVVSFNGSSLNDYQTLSLKLEKNIELLTSNCTMTGKAHDELHKWLLPYIDLVDELSNTKNKKESAEKYTELKESFKTFNLYFL